MTEETPWTLRPGDIFVSGGREVLVLGAPHANTDDPDPTRRYLVVCRVAFRTTGRTGVMTFDPPASVPRYRFDPTRVWFEVSAPDGWEAW